MSDVRDRVMEGALACIGRYGMAKTTVDDVARASGVSRATIYRYFPGGRDQVVADVVAWEVGRFFQHMGEAVAALPDLASLVSEALRFAHRAVAEHEVLQRVLATEPHRLLPILTVSSDRILPLVAGFLVPYMERERVAGRLRSGLEVERAADFLARMLLSWISAPGAWDLEDPEQRAALVRGQLLAGILRPSAPAAGA